MRDYSFAGDNELREDGSNLSSVLAKLCKQEQMKQSLLDFIRSLPEQDITDISCYQNAAMLWCACTSLSAIRSKK